MRKLKTPKGILVEEYKTGSLHFFSSDGELMFREHDPQNGNYTGRFRFEFGMGGGEHTPWYTKKTAPKWLLRLYDIATGCGEDL